MQSCCARSVTVLSQCSLNAVRARAQSTRERVRYTGSEQKASGETIPYEVAGLTLIAHRIHILILYTRTKAVVNPVFPRLAGRPAEWLAGRLSGRLAG